MDKEGNISTARQPLSGGCTLKRLPPPVLKRYLDLRRPNSHSQ
nr:MAG TPA: hypothetical protein [Caudoviricetes sp.]